MKTLTARLYESAKDLAKGIFTEITFKVQHSGQASQPATGKQWTYHQLIKSKYTRLLVKDTGAFGRDYSYEIQPETIDIWLDGSIRKFNASKVKNGKPTYGLYDFSEWWYKIEITDAPPCSDLEYRFGEEYLNKQ